MNGNTEYMNHWIVKCQQSDQEIIRLKHDLNNANFQIEILKNLLESNGIDIHDFEFYSKNFSKFADKSSDHEKSAEEKDT
jgi:hypothetical protein